MGRRAGERASRRDAAVEFRLKIPMPAYCEVALPVPLDRTFTYAVRRGSMRAAGRAGDCALPQREADRGGDGVDAKAPPDVEIRSLEAVLDESRC
jgi:hypothetical protein